VPCMAFRQFPHMRTHRNISIWMTVIYAQHVVYVNSGIFAGELRTVISMLNLGHVVLALCVWSLGWSFDRFVFYHFTVSPCCRFAVLPS
jgi:hypothetical protein